MFVLLIASVSCVPKSLPAVKMYKPRFILYFIPFRRLIIYISLPVYIVNFVLSKLYVYTVKSIYNTFKAFKVTFLPAYACYLWKP